MPLILTVTPPHFVLILAGYLSVWRGLIDRAGVRGLTGFVFYFALPLTLFHSLANAPVAEALPMSGRKRETSFMVVMKLFAYPALVYGLMSLALADLDPVWRAVAVIAAAVPMGASVYLLAAQYEAYVHRPSTAVLASTVLSVITVSALVAALGQ